MKITLTNNELLVVETPSGVLKILPRNESGREFFLIEGPDFLISMDEANKQPNTKEDTKEPIFKSCVEDSTQHVLGKPEDSHNYCTRHAKRIMQCPTSHDTHFDVAVMFKK